MDNESGDYHNIRLCDPVEIPRSMCRGFVSAIDRRHFDIIDFTVDWVSLEGYGMRIFKLVEWPTEKPPAHLSIDDRALLFTGEWPTMEFMESFKPWNKKDPQ